MDALKCVRNKDCSILVAFLVGAIYILIIGFYSPVHAVHVSETIRLWNVLYFLSIFRSFTLIVLCMHIWKVTSLHIIIFQYPPETHYVLTVQIW